METEMLELRTVRVPTSAPAAMMMPPALFKSELFSSAPNERASMRWFV